MSRLPRPKIPVAVCLRVVLRQLGEMWIDDLIASCRKQRILGQQFISFKALLAKRLGCEIADLRLDHDPALENREKLVELPHGTRSRVMVVPKGAKVVRYFPDANDPEFLFYRPHATRFAGSHDTKTRIRGDHGQLSDNAIAKKERRRLRKLDPKRRRGKIQSRGFANGLKRAWPKRPFR